VRAVTTPKIQLADGTKMAHRLLDAPSLSTVE